MTDKIPTICCDICQQAATLLRGQAINKDFPDLPFWYCESCDAWIGVMPDSNFKPGGRFGNQELRVARKVTFAAFDQVVSYFKDLHQTDLHHARRKAYGWLRHKIGIPREIPHIMHFTAAQCDQATIVCNQYIAARQNAVNINEGAQYDR